VILNFLLTNIILASISGWDRFDKTVFKWEYDEDLGLEVQIPYFDKNIKSLEGKTIELSGHYLPMNMDDDQQIILSKFPYASCFFCGGNAGPESVVEVFFSKKPRKFRMDEIIKVKGKLVLNERDYDHLIFIIEEAEELK